MPSFGERLLGVFESHGHLCVGIDPSVSQLRSWELPDSAQGAKNFAFSILDAVRDHVGIIKPQVAFFEQFGPEGLAALTEVLEEAQSRGLLVIADAKRGDIGSTMEAYSRAWLSSEAVFVCDALTVSPYLGLDSLNDTVEIALQNSRGLFILAATSNPEALPIQSSERNGQSVAASVLSFASSNGKGKLGSVGVVLGATVEFSGLGIDVGVAPSFPVLVPGFGAQGARLSEARELLGAYASVSVCSVSRSVAGDSLNGLEDRVLKAKSELEIGFRE